MARLTVQTTCDILVHFLQLCAAVKVIMTGDYEATGKCDPELTSQIFALRDSFYVIEDDAQFKAQFVPEALESHTMFLLSHLKYALGQANTILDRMIQRQPYWAPHAETRRSLQMAEEVIYQQVRDVTLR